MGDLNVKVDIERLMSFGDDLIGVLNVKKDGESFMQIVEGEKLISNETQSDVQEINASLEECQKRVGVCKEKLKNTRTETIVEAEIVHLQNDLEEKFQKESMLCEELRMIDEERDRLEHQIFSNEKQIEAMMEKEKDLLQAENLLSMCASVANIVPDNLTRISGFMVDRNKKKSEKFELENSLPKLEACNYLWRLVDND